MGCFNHKCNFSQLPAKCGDRIVVLVGVRMLDCPISIDHFSPGNSFTPISVLIRGEYDDYGGIQNVDRTPGIDALEKFFDMNVVKIVECAERISADCKDQIEDDYEKIHKIINAVTTYSDSDKIEFSYIMEHESIFDELISMNDLAVKDFYHGTIPHECIEELGYTKNIIGKERAYDVIIWNHPTLPELKETCYVWKTEDFGDYGKVCHTITDLCKYIGCDVPEKYNERYYEARFKADIDFLLEKEKHPEDIKYIFKRSPDKYEYSFLRFAQYGLFRRICSYSSSKHLICSLGDDDTHMKPEYMKEIIEVALLYNALISLNMTWNNTSYYNQDIDYGKHIQFLEKCLDVAKEKYSEYTDEY